MRHLTRYAAFAALLASLGPVTHAAAQGCAMCGTVLGANDPRTIAFKVSIIFLLSAPYALASTVAIWLYVLSRRARAAARAEAAAAVPLGGLTTEYKESPS